MSPAKTGRDFLDLNKVSPADIRFMLSLAHKLKRDPQGYKPLKDKVLSLIFEKPSTRTRVSFEVGMRQLGGQVITLTGAEIQLGRGETIFDTGRVLSRYADILMLRTFAEKKLYELADGATVPVINGLTDRSHPCQIMADIMTVEERLGSLEGKTVAWVGDGDNNILTSWMHAAPLYNINLRIICPPEFTTPKELLMEVQKQGAKITVTSDLTGVDGADVVITDCWVSMHNSDAAARHTLLTPYQVDNKLMKRAAKDAIFMHCLPAHRGEEVTNDVLDSAQSAVWDEAENRMHAQKAVICWCMNVGAELV